MKLILTVLAVLGSFLSTCTVSLDAQSAMPDGATKTPTIGSVLDQHLSFLEEIVVPAAANTAGSNVAIKEPMNGMKFRTNAMTPHSRLRSSPKAAVTAQKPSPVSTLIAKRTSM